MNDMKDREFLFWLHERLCFIHGERDDSDYMWKLRNIIAGYEPDKITPNVVSTELSANNITKLVYLNHTELSEEK